MRTISRSGLTGLETAIILVAFVITSSAFAIVVLNMGQLSAEQAQSVTSSSIDETNSALRMDTDIIGTFSNITGARAPYASQRQHSMSGSAKDRPS